MATQLEKVSKDGKSAGSVDVAESVFGLTPNTHVLHLALRRELANARAGSANSKTKGQVRGGGKKPFKQKGTGRARAGSIRSPLWVGGGVIFGPKPKDYGFDLPKKVRALALRSSLSAARNKFRVFEDFSFLKTPKTKDFAAVLKALGFEGKKVLVLADLKAQENANLQLSARNIPGVKVSLSSNLSVKDLIEADAVLITQGAVEEINTRYAS